MKGGGKEQLWSGAPLQAELSESQLSRIAAEKNRTVRVLKLSLPFSDTSRGCEFLYAAIIERFPETRFPTHFVRFNQTRKLVRFAYDYKNSRCESKDLSFFTDDPPEEVIVQLVDTELSETELIETPRPLGLYLRFSPAGTISAGPIPVSASEPFRGASRAPRLALMSADVAAADIDAAFGPLESFPALVQRELQRSVENCQLHKQCEPVRAAISSIRDYEMLRAFDEARAVGLPVDVIINAGERAYYPGSHRTDAIKDSPWMWLRGNRERGPFGGILQMHTKFVVFGDRLAMSSNNNITGETRFLSRGLSVLYRTPQVVRMFQSLHAVIRAALPYPYAIDRRKNFSLLLNFERPRRHVAAAQRSYTPIASDEGYISSAYGILLDELARRDGKFELFMSPITDACFRYDRERCLLKELERRAARQQLHLGLAGTFYLKHLPDQPLTAPFWQRTSAEEAQSWQPRFRRWRNLWQKSPAAFSVYAGRQHGISIHHERYGVIHPDTVLSGSANFVFPQSLNTLEMIRVPKIFSQVADEIETYKEPYIVLPFVKSFERFGVQFKDCLFIAERPMDSIGLPPQKAFSGDRLVNESRALWPDVKVEDLRLIVPEESFWTTANDSVQMRDVPLAESVMSLSSYMCVWNKEADKSAVFRVSAATSPG